MEISKQEAIYIAEKYVDSVNTTDLVLIDLEEEYDVGFVFSYQSAKYLITQDLDDMVIGGPAIFVDRFSGELKVLRFSDHWQVMKQFSREHKDKLLKQKIELIKNNIKNKILKMFRLN